MATKHSLTLDQVHELIDRLERENSLGATSREMRLSAYERPVLSDAILDLFGGWTAHGTELSKVLGVKPELVNRFGKGEALTATQVGRIGERTLSYLKSIEGEIAGQMPATAKQPVLRDGDAQAATQSESFAGELWKSWPNDNSTKLKLARLSELLEQLISAAKGKNSHPDSSAFSEIERAQLIALLETALQLLKAPMAEKGLFKKTGSALAKITKRVVEKEVEEGLGTLADAAKDALVDIMNQLF